MLLIERVILRTGAQLAVKEQQLCGYAVAPS